MWRSRLNRRPARQSARRVAFFSLLLAVTACTPSLDAPEPEELDTGTTGVGGVVRMADGTVAAGAFVYAYRSPQGGLRGPADFGVRVNRDGRYFLDLVEGEYHLVARLRQTGADAGPPRPGDAWAIHGDNPVRVAEGAIRTIDFALQAGAVPRQVRTGSLAAGDTGFRGRLVDAQGRPMPGAFVLAYRDADFHRMPDLTSSPADDNGRFALYVGDVGRYCLAARTQTRGQPRAGEPYGTLGEGEGACRQAVAGEIRDIGTIVLAPYR